jgi:hypothetical protein
VLVAKKCQWENEAMPRCRIHRPHLEPGEAHFLHDVLEVNAHLLKLWCHRRRAELDHLLLWHLLHDVVQQQEQQQEQQLHDAPVQKQQQQQLHDAAQQQEPPCGLHGVVHQQRAEVVQPPMPAAQLEPMPVAVQVEVVAQA